LFAKCAIKIAGFSATTIQNLANFESMKPKKSPHYDRQKNLFRVKLCRIVDPGHGLIKLANVVDWDRLDERGLKNSPYRRFSDIGGFF
jgi:hypothetical protein